MRIMKTKFPNYVCMIGSGNDIVVFTKDCKKIYPIDPLNANDKFLAYLQLCNNKNMQFKYTTIKKLEDYINYKFSLSC